MKYGDEAVLALLDLLNKEEIAYMLVGSFSSNAYGEARATNDADFVVEMDAEARSKVLRQLPDDFEIDWQVSFETITGHTRQILRVPSIPFEIELFDLSEEPFDQSRFSRRVESSVEGSKVWLPTPEDVVVQKLRWSKLGNRPKDLLDVIGVLRVRGDRIDWQYVESWCSELGLVSILGQAREAAGHS